MSQVRMCDGCGEIFSVNVKGWRSFQENYTGTGEDYGQFHNANNHGAITRDMGPCCAMGNNTPVPRIAIANTKGVDNG